ncbi:S8 family serine peptidase [Streptomyces sp. NPDC006617]|uniref:S8 family serine peptidase n=1 Tax=Streptomyces sp. NPDC006617 TaxID=3155354 RepID=UPI0033BCC610
MEWAVRDQHAKIVSMSLGDSPTDGTDPLSEALNPATAKRPERRVVAAGNSGPEAYTVGTPAAADAALTVGAVNGPGKGVDQRADFSSRGPRVGDNAIKPDLTARVWAFSPRARSRRRRARAPASPWTAPR